MSFKAKVILLWKVFLFLFANKYECFNIRGNTEITVGINGITLLSWMKNYNRISGKNEIIEEDWEHWGVTFDGKEAIGYINGAKVT